MTSPRANARGWRDSPTRSSTDTTPDTGIYEQFAGFDRTGAARHRRGRARRPIAADLLLGAERVRGAQVVKQADVLMLHHLVPDEIERREPRAEPALLRAAHRARQLALAGDPRRACSREPATSIGPWRRCASRAAIDLDDLTGTTAGGLHLATMGGLWQAFAFGFAGLRPRGGVLHLDPRLPPAWTRPRTPSPLP